MISHAYMVCIIALGDSIQRTVYGESGRVLRGDDLAWRGQRVSARSRGIFPRETRAGPEEAEVDWGSSQVLSMWGNARHDSAGRVVGWREAGKERDFAKKDGNVQYR